MALKAKYQYKHEDILRDARPWTVRFADTARQPSTAAIAFAMAATSMYVDFPLFQQMADLTFLIMLFYFWWLKRQKTSLPFKLPKSANRPDPNYKLPGGGLGKSDGILYLGNDSDTGEEVWFTNSDARTHCLYLGTTGSGKTFGLKSFSCNALCWASGFIYIDGKADTDLWSTLSAMARRFGRDDDLLIMNYMTGNVGGRVPSNTLNPFSSGSASYLTNMLVSLMPDSEGDNAMWKERAVALVSGLMPCLVWKRDHQNIPLSIAVIRQYLVFKQVIKLSRDASLPEHLRKSVRAYLSELPGYDAIDSAFDDEGNVKPSPDGSMVDVNTPYQQHGYLSMQFTRSMQSLGDDYGFIFDTQAADIDMLDVVLNRRILIVLIPALEKSSDETANLGKIIASTLKGMMGATLGSTVEGDTATAIENKPTNSSTPFMAIFDEVGYYTAAGMAVMAAQARSLGFSLVFAAQDLPALEKRVKEEARSITANCNIKMFGKLEDPTSTKDFFEKTVGQAIVTEVSGYARGQNGGSGGYMDSQNASVQVRAKAGYDGLKGFNEGKAICAFGKIVCEMQVYNSHIGHAKAMRVHRFLAIPPPAEDALISLRQVDAVLRRLRNPKWNPAQQATPPSKDIEALAKGFSEGRTGKADFVSCGIISVTTVAEAHGNLQPSDVEPIIVPDLSNKRMPDAAAEAAAAAAIAKTGTGPLSWSEVIGGSAPAFMSPATPTLAEEPVARPNSWEEVLGTSSTPNAAEKAQGAALSSPLSWGDVLGLPAAAPVPVQQPIPQAPVAPPVGPPLVAKPFTDAEQTNMAKANGLNNPLSWTDVLGLPSSTEEKK